MSRSLSIAALLLVFSCGHWPRAVRAAEGAPADSSNSAPSPAQEVRLSRPLRVLTANIYNRTEPYVERMKLMRQQLSKLDPDVIGFQEAAWRPGADHQVKQLLEGMSYFIDHQCDGAKVTQPTDVAVAVASRWPISRRGLWTLPGSGVALAVEVAAPPPVGRFLFVSTVGAARWPFDAEANRERDAVAMDKMIRQTASPHGFPAIVAGDFDATPDSACMRFLTGLQSLAGASTHYWDAWQAAGNRGPGYTWSTENHYVRELADRIFHLSEHHRRIDYILVGSPHHYRGRARVVSCRVALNEPAGNVWPSDHFGVLAEVAGLP
jgi:endonuclease/exonuclease/phosphatase family metal-dependent hydrolase